MYGGPDDELWMKVSVEVTQTKWYSFRAIGLVTGTERRARVLRSVPGDGQKGEDDAD
jgi:hypothetical protein